MFWGGGADEDERYARLGDRGEGQSDSGAGEILVKRKFCVFLLERGISDEKGEFGKQKQKKLCKIWEINDDETNCILTKLKRHKIIKKLSKSVDKRGILGYNNTRRR